MPLVLPYYATATFLCVQLARAGRDPRYAREHSLASTNSSLMESEVAEVEMLLEAYFMVRGWEEEGLNPALSRGLGFLALASW